MKAPAGDPLVWKPGRCRAELSCQQVEHAVPSFTGDGNSNTFHGYQYSPGVANVFTDTNLEPTADWHPLIEDVVYWGMDWVCPNDNSMLSHQLNAFHGNITAENTIRDILP